MGLIMALDAFAKKLKTYVSHRGRDLLVFIVGFQIY